MLDTRDLTGKLGMFFQLGKVQIWMHFKNCVGQVGAKPSTPSSRMTCYFLGKQNRQYVFWMMQEYWQCCFSRGHRFCSHPWSAQHFWFKKSAQCCGRNVSETYSNLSHNHNLFGSDPPKVALGLVNYVLLTFRWRIDCAPRAVPFYERCRQGNSARKFTAKWANTGWTV